MSKYTKEMLEKFCQENSIELIKDYSNEKIWCEMPLEGKCITNECVNNFKKMFKHLIKHNGYCKQCLKGKGKDIVVYNYKLLKTYCDKKNIILDNDYSKEKIGVLSTINGICETELCGNKFKCKFRNLINFGALCKECFYKKRSENSKQTCLQKYGVEFVAHVPGVREKAEQSMLAKYGVKYTTQSKDLCDKMKQNNIEKYGCEYTLQSKEVKDKIKETCLEKYGVENPSQSKEVQDKKKETCLEKYGVEYSIQSKEVKQKSKETISEKYGVEHYFQSEDKKKKSKETCLEKYGVEHVTQSKKIQKKIKETCLEKYGVENYFQSEDKQNKSKETCLQKYGVEFVSQVPEIKDKKKETCLEHYGVENPNQSEEVKQKSKETCLEKYGVEFVSQVPEIRRKSEQTCLEKYGVKHPAQNTEIMEKCSKNAYKSKEYIFPSGNIINIQGYEHYALDQLIEEGLSEEDIKTGSKNVPELWYYDESSKKHRHYVDIYIVSQNRCIEVKSTWTAEKKKDCIFLKQESGKKAGFNYEIWVYSQKGEKVDCYV